MSNTMRGSEKLQGSCGTMRTLSLDEVNTVAGGVLGTTGFYYTVFPLGTPRPDMFASFNIKQLANPIPKF